MAELLLDRDERLELRSQAHHLQPVVLLGANGLTDAVIKEVDRALTAHELIKIRVPSDDREEREEIFSELLEKLGAARVQVIGKLLVLWRPSPEKRTAEAERAKRRQMAENHRPTRGGPTAARKTRARAPGRQTKKSFGTAR